MAKTISKLSIRLTLNADEIKQGAAVARGGLDQISKKAGQVNRQAGAASGGLRGLSGGMGGITSMALKMAGPLAAAGAAFLSLKTVANGVAQAFAKIDETAKFADRIGIGINQLEALKLAAQGGGASIGTLQTSLQRMTRRVSEAALGSGTAVKALEELGLEATTLKNLSPDQMFKAVADAMQGVTSQGDRVRLAMALFDTEGVALLNTLDSIAGDGLAKVEQRADELGKTMSRFDASQVEALNDAWLELQTAVQGVWQQLAITLAPVLTAFINEILLPMAEGLVAVAKGFRSMFEWMGLAKKGTVDLAKSQERAKGLNDALASQASELTKKTKQQTDALKAQEAERKKLLDSVKAFDKEEARALEASRRVRSQAASTVGAVGMGTSGAMAAVQQITNQAKADARNEERHRKLVAESNARRERFLADIDKKLAALVRKDPVRVTEVSTVG